MADKEEIVQWIQSMIFLMGEYDRVVHTIVEAWKKGADDYREVWVQGELPALLEKVREMPVPKESSCKSAKKNFEKGVEAQIKARELSAKYTGKGVPDRIWKTPVVGWLSMSDSMLKNMGEDFVSVRKKYQV